MSEITRQRAMALSAMMQSICLLDRLVFHGESHTEKRDVLLQHLPVLDGSRIREIYGDTQGLRTGLVEAHRIYRGFRLYDNDKRLLAGFRALVRHGSRRFHDQRTLDQLASQLASVDESGKPNLPALAALHTDNDLPLDELLKPMREALKPYPGLERLHSPAVEMEARAIALAGVRATILWRKAGGATLVLFFRRTVAGLFEELLQELENAR